MVINVDSWWWLGGWCRWHWFFHTREYFLLFDLFDEYKEHYTTLITIRYYTHLISAVESIFWYKNSEHFLASCFYLLYQTGHLMRGSPTNFSEISSSLILRKSLTITYVSVSDPHTSTYDILTHCSCIYIYIYIYHILWYCLCIYIYIRIHTCIYIYINYIYIYI